MHFELELTQALQTVARCCRGHFFSSRSGPGSSVGGMRLEKHWVQLLFDSGLSSRGAFFSLVDLGLGAAVGGMRIEIHTGYSCYLKCNNS